jgi:hypothetical protein
MIPPKRAIQSPAFSGKGNLPPCPKTIHNPPNAKLKLKILCQPCFFFKKIISKCRIFNFILTIFAFFVVCCGYF